jgi:N-acetylglucosaminyl-diphospho-decaprenol L-rhamnosyltransferase
VKVSAVVISHDEPGELERCVRALIPDVDELLVVANTPQSAGPLPPGVGVIVNDRPRGFAANANAGISRTRGDVVVVANADAIPRSGAVRALAAFMSGRPRCGIAGPQLVYPDGRWQPSRRAFPTVSGTLVRRTPLRLLVDPARYQRSHYLLDERPDSPVEADWMLGAFLLHRRELLDELGAFDGGYRLYCEDIDLCYRAARAGWERWYVPEAVVEHAYPAEIDRTFLSRRTAWHARGMLRFVRKHPERLLAF